MQKPLLLFTGFLYYGTADENVHVVILTLQTHAKVWHSYNNTWRSEQQGNKGSFCNHILIYIEGLKIMHKLQNCHFVF